MNRKPLIILLCLGMMLSIMGCKSQNVIAETQDNSESSSESSEETSAQSGISSSALHENIKTFNNQIMVDFGYDLLDYEEGVDFSDDSLPDDVVFFTCNLDKGVGCKRPFVYHHKGTDEYLVVYQDANIEKTIITLDMSLDESQTRDSGESYVTGIQKMPGEEVDFANP